MADEAAQHSPRGTGALPVPSTLPPERCAGAAEGQEKPLHRSIARRKVLYTFALALIFAAGLLLRFWGLGRLSLWFDEGYSAWAASLAPAQLFHVIRADVSPPLYYLLLRGWIGLFGNSEIALRALSAAAASACLPLLYLLAQRLLQRPAALVVAMALGAASVMQITYAHEARCYALLGLACLLALYALHRFLERRRPWSFAVIVLATVFTLYLHNIAFFYLLGLDLAWLILPAPLSRRRRLLDLLLANGLVVLLYLPWVPGLLSQLRWVQANFWAPRPSFNDLVNVLCQLMGVQPQYPGGQYNLLIPPQVYRMVNLLAILAVLWPLRLARLRRRTVALLIYAVAPVLLIYLYSLVARPLFMSRPLIASSLVFPLLLAMPFASDASERRRTRAVPLAVARAAPLLILLWAAISSLAFLRFEKKEDWRSASQYVMQIPTVPRAVFFTANEGQLIYEYYAQRQQGSENPPLPARPLLSGLPTGFLETDPPIPAQRVLDEQDLAHLADTLAAHPVAEVDLVLTHQIWSNPRHLPQAWLTAHGWRCIDTAEFWKVRIERYQRPGSRMAK
jgi:uncharacterized membrane protein